MQLGFEVMIQIQLSRKYDSCPAQHIYTEA